MDISVEDPGKRLPPPPNGSQFFRFDFYFAEKRPCRRLTPASLTNREMLAMTVCAQPVTVSSLLKTTAKCLASADPRGAAGTRPPQTGPNTFVFATFSPKSSRVGGQRPPPREISDPPLLSFELIGI